MSCFRLGESSSHVAALLFKVEAAVRLGYTRCGCTELPCYWNNDFVKKVKPAPVHCIQFYKKSANKKLCQQSKQNRYGAPRISTDKEENKLLHSLASCSRKPVGLSLLKEQYQPFCWKTTAKLESLGKQLTSLYKQEYASMTLTELNSEVEEILASLVVTDAVNQAACTAWFQMHAGRITASRAHSILHTRLDHPSASAVTVVSLCMMLQLRTVRNTKLMPCQLTATLGDIQSSGSARWVFAYARNSHTLEHHQMGWPAVTAMLAEW